MMGPRQKCQPKLFYANLNLDQRIPADHPLRKIAAKVDFNFIRPIVRPLYGRNGHCSLDPAVTLKLMFLLFYEQVPSERALLSRLPMRLDWLWFCGYDLDAELPDHSVLSKARRRWGKEVFEEFFERILGQCVEAGLVDGTVVHIDSSMIDGSASKDKLQVYLRGVGGQVYEQLDLAEGLIDEASDESNKSVADATPELSADEVKPSESMEFTESPKPGQRITPVDPDARLGKKYGQTTLGYKDHRAVDDRCGIITATITTPANVNDDRMLAATLDSHEANTGVEVETVAGDKIYGTATNYKDLHDRGVTPCIPHKNKNCNCDPNFVNDRFVYDAAADEYICPAGKRLQRRQVASDKNAVIYEAPREVCADCVSFEKCVSSKTTGRRVSRNFNQDHIDWADTCMTRAKRKRFMARRKAKVEGSFADAANNHGFKRARWRGLMKMSIQNLLIAAAQNLRKLLRAFSLSRGKSMAGGLFETVGASFSSLALTVQSRFLNFCDVRDRRSVFFMIVN